MRGSSLTEPFAGIYEVSDAARIIYATSPRPQGYPVTNRHIIRWIRRGLALPSLADVPGRELLMSFPDLISMRVIALLRMIGVSFHAIYTAERWLRDTTGVTRPFATEIIWTESRHIFTDRAGQLIAASLGGQYAFTELMEEHLIPIAGLTFDPSGIADSWAPHGFDVVVLRPDVQFGAPCIRGTRTPTRALWEMYQGGDSPPFLAEVYDLSLANVQSAIEWETCLAAA